MNKKIELKSKTVVLFFVEVVALLASILFRNYYTYQGYVPVSINVMFIINLIIFIIGLVFIFMFIKTPNCYDDKKSIIIIIICFVLYLLLNFTIPSLINKPLNKEYAKISDELLSYCDTYVCDRYETITNKNIREFIIRKSYPDYNGQYNDIEIVTKYDNNSVLSVVASVISSSDLFSETLVAEKLEIYFNNFGVQIDEQMIRKAFENRYEDSLKKDNVTYKVEEIYNNEDLISLNTIITLNLKQY